MNFAYFSVMMATLWLFCSMVLEKKTQKLKNSDIEKAVKLKNEYYDNKGKE